MDLGEYVVIERIELGERRQFPSVSKSANNFELLDGVEAWGRYKFEYNRRVDELPGRFIGNLLNEQWRRPFPVNHGFEWMGSLYMDKEIAEEQLNVVSRAVVVVKRYSAKDAIDFRRVENHLEV